MMHFYSIFLSIFLLLSTKTLLAVKRPSYLPICYRNDPNLNTCLIEATEKVKPYLAKDGVPEIKFPGLEPLKIPEIELIQQGTNALNIKATLKDILIHGLSNYKFSKFDFDVPNLQFYCNATIDNLFLEGNYEAVGRILIAPIAGKGTFTAEIDRADAYIYQKYKETLFKDGKIHLEQIKTVSSINVLKPRANIKGLFNGNEQLNAITNKAINDNVDQLFEDLKPVIEHTISKIMEDLFLKSFLDNLAYEDLYPIGADF